MDSTVTTRRETNWEHYHRLPQLKSAQMIAARLFTYYFNQYQTGPLHIAELGGANSTIYRHFVKSNKQNITQYDLIDQCLPALNNTQIHSAYNTRCIHANILDSAVMDTLQHVYDVVFSLGLIQYFSPENTARAIQKHFELLKPNGVLIMTYATPSLSYRATRGLLTCLKSWVFHDERPLLFKEVDQTAAQHGRLRDRKKNHALPLTQEIVVYKKFASYQSIT